MDLSYFQDPETGEFKQRPETKTYADVVRVVEKHKGTANSAIDKTISLYLDGLQWDWLEEYQQWQEDHTAIEAWNAEFAGTVSHTETVRVITGEGDNAVVSFEERDVLYEAQPLPVEPIRPPVVTVEQWSAGSSELSEHKKLLGVEFNGVMCSATAADQWGLGSIKDWVKAGGETVFHFENGNKLLLNQSNIDSFDSVWVPFRASFFN